MAAAKLVMMGEPLPNTLATTPITPAAPASFASTTWQPQLHMSLTAWAVEETFYNIALYKLLMLYDIACGLANS